MKILIAPNSMKGSLNAFEFSDAIEEGFNRSAKLFEFKKIPVADGGDFTGPILEKVFKAQEVGVVASNPLGKKINVCYAIAKDTAIIEMANISGIKLLSDDELNPMVTSSYGTGELIQDAIQKGCKKIFVGVGGSATVDGGIGMLFALGARCLDKNGNELPAKATSLSDIKKIEWDSKINSEIEIIIISDVVNPLLGKNGAARIFGPQKGATPAMVEELEKGLANWARVLFSETNIQVADMQGAGAAGGIATGLVVFLNAKIVSGADFILDQLNFDAAVQWADLVITGEGKIDSTTNNNKAPYAVALRAEKLGKPVIAIAGSSSLEEGELFHRIFSLSNSSITTDYAIKNAKKLVVQVSEQIARFESNMF